MPTRTVLAGLCAASLIVLTACGSSTTRSANHPGDSSMSPGMRMPTASSPTGMGNMPMRSGTGLSATVSGYTLTLRTLPLNGGPRASTFTIFKNGKPVTKFDHEQTKLMHFYLIRSDLTGFQHLHPTMSSTGIWSVSFAALTAGSYRMYVQFLPHADASSGALVLSRPVIVSGGGLSAPLAAPASTATVDGYTLILSGIPKARADTPLSITVSKSGAPVTDLQPYLDTYAHVTAIHERDLAFAHLHPKAPLVGDHGGPTLMLNADLPETGLYRMFVQFQTGGTLHTAAFTLSVTG